MYQRRRIRLRRLFQCERRACGSKHSQTHIRIQTDVRDRIYTTSKLIIEENLADFTDFAGKIGKLAQLKNFPVHIEVRRENGVLMPIEVNPMRFGGWCTTADISHLAYGFNPYLCYFLQEKPNWDEALKRKRRQTL